MKIALVLPAFQRGGAERVAALLSREWAKTRDVVFVVFDGRDPAFPPAGRIVDLGIGASRGIVRKMGNVFVRALSLAKVLEHENPDRIVSFMESANIPAVLAAAKVGMLDKLHLSVHIDPTRIAPAYIPVAALLYRLAREVIVISARGAEKLRRLLLLPRDRVRFVPNPLDLAEIEQLSAAQSPFHSAVPYIFAVGRLSAQKGFDLLIDAFGRTPRGNTHLCIAGEGPDRHALQERVASLGLGERVSLIGPVENPYALMHGAELFVLSSRYEGWPLVLAEALACGRPCIAFDCDTGPREMIEDGVSGVLVRMGDVDGLATAISNLLKDKEKRHSLGHAGKAQSAEWALPIVAARWLNKDTN